MMSLAELRHSIENVRVARDRGVAWILSRIESNGKPTGASKRNGWARAPWALAGSGENEAAAAILSWAERGQLTAEGFFADSRALGVGRFPAYPLAHLAIGAWLAGRIDLSLRIMSALRSIQNSAGGLPIALPDEAGNDTADLLSTAQVGQAAVITGQDDIADGVFRWVSQLIHDQPSIESGLTFYCFRKGGNILVDPGGPLAWPSITNFRQPRQAFYTPGMAAVFLTMYGARSGLDGALAISRKLLQMNIDGCEEQFTDPESVQICKFGWGVSLQYQYDAKSDLLPHVARMGNWFIDHQAVDGSWSPSAFLVKEPSDVDKMLKTTEHVMEVNAILAALGAAQGRISG